MVVAWETRDGDEILTKLLLVPLWSHVAQWQSSRLDIERPRVQFPDRSWFFNLLVLILISIQCVSVSQCFIINLRVWAVFHKTVRVCHVYCNFKIGFTCWITVIFGTLTDGSLLSNTLASNICLSYRKMFQNGVDTLSKIVDAFFVKKLKILSSSDYPIMFKFC